ncbi:YihY/virulence factor BrkB family protein [Arthrobacter sp. I2-34]|uniref:YihY/virulence factor BrkB family protein n=1 Tax=Arthrobacter hankyongi TaxID=2904801 RepID=A0ABS9L2E4_9MICC|nr:YihY/virulence factor BrkB family protein [Arthrobacter hankyongi]MCG2620839.1 YihY/virulence factor BrkB family protein [Arthrobacter hankyongi]
MPSSSFLPNASTSASATEQDESSAANRHAPAPDDERKPDSPTDIQKPAWKYVLKRTFREFSRDQCTDLAAALTYFGVLSLFPALLALVSLLGVVGQAEQTTQTMMRVVQGVASPEVAQALRQPIEQLASAPSAGFALIAGLAGAIWSASGYVGAFGRAMNRIYEIDEGRPFWKLRPVILLITVVMLLLAVIAAILLIVSGPLAETLGNAIGLGGPALAAWNIAKWPVLLAFAVLMIAVLYYATPNVKQPKFRWMSLGSLIALVLLGLATLGFFFYVSNFGHYNKTYGAIGGVIVLLLWLWIANNSLLFGAEFDAEMERGRQLQAGIEAEDAIQLPPRDTKASDKRLEKEKEDIHRGRALRQENGNSEH